MDPPNVARGGPAEEMQARPPWSGVLRARTLLTLGEPPIDNGALLIIDGCIAQAGTWTSLRGAGRGETVDLGSCIALPGFVNAHCHLDYTEMLLPPDPERTFVGWIKEITNRKAAWGAAEFAASWRRGADELIASGVTTVADVEAFPSLLPNAWRQTPLRVFSFLEMTGVKSRRDPEAILAEALAQVELLRKERNTLGLAPHAPYSTVPALLRKAAAAAQARGLRLTVHVAESLLEHEMFTAGRGEMFAWLQRNERDMSDCGLGTPVAHLARNACLGPNLIAVHANYVSHEDAAMLGRSGTHVVHCPRSHAYFGHGPFPFERLRAAGVNMCLGTDSGATVARVDAAATALSMVDEMRMFAAAHPGCAPEQVLRLATVHGARALGCEHRIGVLAPGALADVIAVPHPDPGVDPYAAVLENRGRVRASLVGGRWAIRP